MRRLGASIGLLVACVAGAATEEAGWFHVPQDEAALVVVADTKLPTVLFVSDGKETLLDKFSWEFDFPLVRQYRLDPGNYRIVFGAGQRPPIDVKLGAGELSYLQIIPDQDTAPKIGIYPATYEPIKANVSAIVDELKFKGYEKLVVPQGLDPADHVLHINTEPPFNIPKPTDPPPQ